MPIALRWIEHGSAEYERMIDLRNEVLRKPLGMEIDRTKLAAEADCGLLTAWEGDQCVGTMVLSVDDDTTARMRAVAVAPNQQGQGIGRLMTDEFESEALRRGLGQVFLHARVVAVPFYERLGYHVEGEEFTEVSIPHRKMRKILR